MIAAGLALVDLFGMSPDAQATDHVFTPILVRAQLMMGGLVLATGAALAGVGACDLSALRSIFGF